MDCAVSTVFYILPWHTRSGPGTVPLYSAAQSCQYPGPRPEHGPVQSLFLDPARGAAVLRHHGLEPQAGYPGGGEQLATSLGGCRSPLRVDNHHSRTAMKLFPSLRSQSGIGLCRTYRCRARQQPPGLRPGRCRRFCRLLALLLRICPLDMTVTAICTDGDRADGLSGLRRTGTGFPARRFFLPFLNGAFGPLRAFSRRPWPPESWARIRGQGMDKRGPSLSWPTPVPCWTPSAGTGPPGSATSRTTSPAAAVNFWAACFLSRERPAPGC